MWIETEKGRNILNQFKKYFLRSKGHLHESGTSIINALKLSYDGDLIKESLLEIIASEYYLNPSTLSNEEKEVFKSSPWFPELKINLRYPTVFDLSLSAKSPNSSWIAYLRENRDSFLIFQENDYITELKLPYKVKSFCIWEDYLVLIDETKTLRVIYLYSLKEVSTKKGEGFDKVSSDNTSLYLIYENGMVQSFKVDETGIKFENIVQKKVETSEKKEPKSLKLGKGITRGLSFSPDGKFLAVSIIEDNKVLVFSTDTFTKVFEKVYNYRPDQVQFSPDGKYLAVGCGDGYVYMYDVSSNFREMSNKDSLKRWVAPVAFSQDTRYFAFGGYSYFAVFELNSKKKLFESFDESIQTISFSPSAEYIAVGSENNKVKVFSIKGDLVKGFNHYNSNYFYTLSFSPDGKFLAYATTNNKIKFVSVKNWQEVKEIEGERFAFSQDGKYGFSILEDKVMVWDMENFNRVKEFVPYQGKEIVSIAVNSQIGFIACGYNDGYFSVLDYRFLPEKKAYRLKNFLWLNPYLIFIDENQGGDIWELVGESFIYKMHVGKINPSKEFKTLEEFGIEGWKVDNDFILFKDGKVSGSKDFQKHINVLLGTKKVSFEDFKDIILTKTLEVVK